MLNSNVVTSFDRMTTMGIRSQSRRIAPLLPKIAPKHNAKSNHVKPRTGAVARPTETLKEIDYRKIATMFVKALPVEDSEFRTAVDNCLSEIKALPVEAKNALWASYVFSSKAPIEEREDLYQTLAVKLLEANVPDRALAYSIAKCSWVDWWRAYRIRQHLSLDSIVEGEDAQDSGEDRGRSLAEMVVNDIDYQLRLDGQVQASFIWDKIPRDIRPIVSRRLEGRALRADERQALSRWTRAHGYKILLACHEN